jgi:hypothetical protein
LNKPLAAFERFATLAFINNYFKALEKKGRKAGTK